MMMQDWIEKIDEFITVTERMLLSDNGTISRLDAARKAYNMYNEYTKH